MRYLLLGLGALTVISLPAAADTPLRQAIAQPVSCIQSTYTATGNQHWKSINLKLTNQCGKAVDFQNATVTFQNAEALNTSFWGDFAPLSYPDNPLNLSSQPQSDGKFLTTLNLHFPTYPGSNSSLPAGSSIVIKYGAASDRHIEGTTKVYLGTPVATGSITLNNASPKPASVSQDYALIHIKMNGQSISDVRLPWGQSQTLSELTPGTYTLSAEMLYDAQQNAYQGQAEPSSLTVTANQISSATIRYSKMQQEGKLLVHLANLPQELANYSENPTVLLTHSESGNSQSQTLNWGTTLTVTQLKEGARYELSTPAINYNGYQCAPQFTPAVLVANATTPPASTLTYQCVQQAYDEVTLEVQGAPAFLSALNVTLTPNDSSSVLQQSISLNNGRGSAVISLPDGVIYTLSSEAVPGFAVTFSPQPLTAAADAKVSITLSQQSNAGGRIIGYIPGWKTPPAAQDLANAGYTHVMIAFGVFSTTNPGAITPAFSTVSKEYIQSLHQAGIRVLLSLGGALTSLPDTSVDFHQVLTAAPSVDAFKQTFMQSLNALITQYNFDGFDIDIEHGINGGGTFTKPQGDIAVLASIINTMHSQHPELLITLTPQVANVAATSGFDATWGNYASLITQTHASLAWVGIQLYNTGCAFGIDQICYGPTPTDTPNFTVAMATDLLADWPATVNGRATGFQPYVSHLEPSQVVIGYPSPNSRGQSDGSPVTPTATIKRALQCLKTATASSTSCGSYIPPQAYGAIGGVFNWEITYDQDNQFKFATDLKNCVRNGICE